MSRIIATALLLFVGVASGALLWDGLALSLAHGRAGSDREVRQGRARVVFGAVGVGIAIWLISGLLTHAW